MGLVITREQAQTKLDSFIPRAGQAYAKKRNFDYGPEGHNHVSQLSPALRRRLITEPEVITKTLGAHSYSAAEKFIQEVFWRTYWKGWLEMRPAIWKDYKSCLAVGFDHSPSLDNALTGQTGIACFDAWHTELLETNYLHNHARMWFASIWIHTLGLPWQAGADLFMRHLSDGDPASNTLGWRWVAGLQTRGKAYAARADNIAQFTNNRFAPYGQLQEDVAAIEGPENPPAMAVRAPRHAAGDKPLLLLTAEDCSAESLPLAQQPVGIAVLPADLVAERAAAVRAADATALADGLARAVQHYGCAGFHLPLAQEWQTELAEMMQQCGADHIVTAYQPTGYWDDLLSVSDLPICEIQRAYDRLCWPHAKKGFFPFKEKIPQFLSSL